MKSCGYCKVYASARKLNKSEIRQGKPARKECKIIKKEVNYNHEPCRYFDLQETFYCDHFKERYHHTVCLHRRNNRATVAEWKFCKKCWQFDEDIKVIIEEHYINPAPKVEPPQQKLSVRREESNKITLKNRRKIDKEKTKLKIRR